ncbi:MAG: hypothetical protein GY768_05450 [Planctomycetaceae bacterium]|nr:hypothetical protein [Planctomycetaceae bacterium]
MASTDFDNAKKSPPAQYPRFWWLWSGLICVHLCAVFVPPFTFISSSPDAVSPLAADVRSLFLPYTTFLHLNHGYAFFAPDPGPNHLIEYRVEFEDGRDPIEQTFPDKDQHWPRLLYHRHFMLSEQLNGDFAPPAIAQDESESLKADWRRRRDRFEAKFESFRAHLVNRYGTEDVQLQLIEHGLPSWDDVQNGGMRLDDRRLYRVIDEWPPVPSEANDDMPAVPSELPLPNEPQPIESRP